MSRSFVAIVLLAGACTNCGSEETTPPITPVADAGSEVVLVDARGEAIADATTDDVDAANEPLPTACGQPTSLDTIEVVHEGRSRTALVHVPVGYNGSPTPMILNYHGLASNASQQQFYTEMNTLADEKGFIVVYPEGVASSWNAGRCCGVAQSRDLDDVGLAHKLVDEAMKNLCVDEERVFVAGMSNGGFMAQRLACEAPERFAGFASVAGGLAISFCTPTIRRPIVQFHGTADRTVPYNGLSLAIEPIRETMTGWAERNGCDSDTKVVFQQGDATCERFANCADDADVELCTIDGGGHTWPGARQLGILGYVSRDLNANAWMWEFFTRQVP